MSSSETATTFCRVCHAACPIEVDLSRSDAGGTTTVTGVRGISDDPLFEGYTCIKGRQLPDQIHDPERIVTPLRRILDGSFEEIASATAFDEIADHLRRIIADHGPRAVASYTGTGGYQNSVAVPVARDWHTAIGSVSHYTSVTIDQPAKTTSPPRVGLWEAGIQGFRDADVLLALGCNPMVSSYSAAGGLQGTNPFTVLRRAKEAGLTLIVVDPRRTEYAAFADVHLAVRPGEDPTLLAGLIRIILDEGLHDHEFCDRWVSQLDDLHAAVAPFTLDHVAARCDVPAADVERAAHLFAGGRRGSAGAGTGPDMAPRSGLTELLIHDLNVICGRFNREGDVLESPQFFSPEAPKRAQVIGPHDVMNGPPARVRGLRGFRGEMPTATLAEEILTPGDGQIRALIVSGGNPVVAFPDQALTVEAMEALELLVVVDHRMTATAELAHYVIAPTLSLERADIPHLMDRWFRDTYTNYTPAVLDRPGDVVNEWEVFWELARRMDTTITLPGGDVPVDHKPTDDEVIDLAYGTSRVPVDHARAHPREIDRSLAITVQPAAADATDRFTVAPPDVVAELATVLAEGDSAAVFTEIDPTDYPFRLTSRRLKTRLNSLGGELPALHSRSSTNHAFMNPADMTDLGLADDDLVEITSPHAALVGVARAEPAVRRSVVSMAHSWGGTATTDEAVRTSGAPTNRLVSTSSVYDPYSGMAVQSAIPVAVRAASTSASQTVSEPDTDRPLGDR